MGVLGIISEASAKLRDGVGQDFVRNERVSPDGMDDPFFGKNIVRVPSKVDEHLHHLGFEVDSLLSSDDGSGLRLDQPVANAEVPSQFRPPRKSVATSINPNPEGQTR